MNSHSQEQCCHRSVLLGSHSNQRFHGIREVWTWGDRALRVGIHSCVTPKDSRKNSSCIFRRDYCSGTRVSGIPVQEHGYLASEKPEEAPRIVDSTLQSRSREDIMEGMTRRQYSDCHSCRVGFLWIRDMMSVAILAALAGCGGGAISDGNQDRTRESHVIQPRPSDSMGAEKGCPDTDRDVRQRRFLVNSLSGSIRDERVLQTLGSVKRHAFMPGSLKSRAYEDEAMPIGEGQTISQPWVVARMTELLALHPDERVLEIGTGSGYQAAVLARLVKEVYTIEIIETLAQRARATLEDLGYSNIHFRVGDGYQGWPSAAPFDAIIITAAVNHPPAPLLDQLKVGGRFVLPLGSPDRVQYLTRITRTRDGYERERFSAVRFVPMTGEAER